MPRSISTKITKLLDDRGIAFRLLRHDKPAFTVDDAARERGVDKKEMVKCILLRDKDAHYVMACVPGNVGVDPKAVRKHMPASWKRLYFASEEEISNVTGCRKGAVAPIGLPETVPVIFDVGILECSKVNISSGEPTAGLELDPKDLAEICRASMAAIAGAETRKE